MHALRFRSAGSSKFDFDDWSEAPALIANLVAPHQLTNTHAAIKTHLATQGVDLLETTPAKLPDTMKFTGQVWRRVSVPGFENLQDVQVAIPVEGEVTRGPKGEFRLGTVTRPSAGQVSEATSFVRSLARHGQIAGQATKGATGTTHQIETDDKGNRRLVRKRFSAL
jgi:hypothetical protein